MAALEEQFADLDLGFVDAAILALSESVDVPRVATADRRRFEAVATRLPIVLVP